MYTARLGCCLVAACCLVVWTLSALHPRNRSAQTVSHPVRVWIQSGVCVLLCVASPQSVWRSLSGACLGTAMYTARLRRLPLRVSDFASLTFDQSSKHRSSYQSQPPLSHLQPPFISNVLYYLSPDYIVARPIFIDIIHSPLACAHAPSDCDRSLHVWPADNS
jgi:hypothetical protein